MTFKQVGTTLRESEVVAVFECEQCGYRTTNWLFECPNCDKEKKEYHMDESMAGVL